MDKEAVLPADLQRDLANGLQKRLGLDVADGAANLRDNTSASVFLPTA